jgi:hypothetical protein
MVFEKGRRATESSSINGQNSLITHFTDVYLATTSFFAAYHPTALLVVE